MDTLTHALSGALAARATEPDAPRTDQLPRRARLWVGFWAAAFPDSDFIVHFFDPLLYLTTHRGITHSVVMLPLWALGLALAFAWISRRRHSWRAFVGVCAIGIGAHILGDVITAFGTMVLAPVSNWRLQLPFTFIIDPYFSAIIVAGLVASFIWRGSRQPALLALAVLAGYIGLQALLHTRAMAIGEQFARERGAASAAVHALPQPFSPFHWLLVVDEGSAYHLSYISLVRTEPAPEPSDGAGWLARVYASYRPAGQAHWQRIARFGDEPMAAQLAEQVWRSEPLARLRHFSLLPAVYRIERGGTTTCVWFNDLRFALDGRSHPFLFGACRNANEPHWRMFELLDDSGERRAVGRP